MKPVGEFYRDSGRGDGFQSSCKDCRKAAVREWKVRNPDKNREHRRQSYERNPQYREKAREYARLYQERNPEKIREYRERNREKIREYQRLWRERNPEKYREYLLKKRRLYRERNPEARRKRSPEEAREAARLWRKRNREKLREASRERRRLYRERNPELWAAARAAQRARRRAKEGTLTAADVEYVAVLRGDPCSYCGADGPSSVDHIEPLHHGGTVDWANLTAACMSCNSSKRTADLLSFLLRKRA